MKVWHLNCFNLRLVKAGQSNRKQFLQSTLESAKTFSLTSWSNPYNWDEMTLQIWSYLLDIMRSTLG